MSLINFGSLFGIKIKAHYSLFFLVFLFAYSLAVGVFPFVAKGYSNAAYWVAGTITTCVFFFTILLHEITHALIARRFGISTTAIIIWLFGGVASLNKESATPGEEFKIGAGGPFSSLAIGGLLFGLGLGLQNIGMDRLTVVAVLWLGMVNIILAIFNLIPAFPMDGGRMLFAALWTCYQDRIRAIKVAAAVGQTFAVALIGVGFGMILFGDAEYILNGVWFTLLGWILLTANRMELEQALFSDSFILRKRHAYYPVRLSVSIAVPGRFQDHEERVVNVIVGVASLANLKKARLNRNHLAYIPISEIITPLDSVPCVEPATATLELVRLLSEEQNHRLLVTRSLPRTLKEYTRSLLASTWDRRGSGNDGHRRGHGNGTGHEDRATQDNGTYLAPPTPAPAHAKHDRHDRHGADAADLMMAGRPSTTSTGGSKDSIDSSRPSDWRGSGLEGEAEAVGERKNEKTGGREMGLAQCIDLESGESAHHRQTARTQPSCTQPPCAQAGDGAEDSGGTFAPLSSLDPDDSATSASPLRMDYTQSPSRRYSPPHRTYSAPTLQHHHQQQQYQHQQHRRSPYRSSSPSVYAALPMSTNSGALDNVLVIPEEDLLGIISYSDVVGYLETTSVLQPLARYSQAGEGQDRSGQLSEMQREEERQRQLQLQADRRARHRAQEEEHAEPGGHRGDKGGDEQLTMDTLHQRGVHDSCGEDKGEGRDDRFTAVGDSVGGGVMGESGHWPHYSTFDD